MTYECLYIAGRCDHQACGDHWDGFGHDEPPQPTVEEYCAAGGHAYAGDDQMDENTILGRCYCGHTTYPPGGTRHPRRIAWYDEQAAQRDGRIGDGEG